MLRFFFFNMLCPISVVCFLNKVDHNRDIQTLGCTERTWISPFITHRNIHEF